MVKTNNTKNGLNQLDNLLKNDQANEQYLKRLAWILIIGLIAYSIKLLNKLPEDVTPIKAYLALGIIWLGTLPAMQYLFDKERPPIPFFPLVGLYYASGFGLPIFSSIGEKKDIEFSISEVTNKALLLVLLGLLGMNISFYIVKYFLHNKILPFKFIKNNTNDRLIYLLTIFLIAHILCVYVPFVQNIPSVGQLLEPVGFISYGIFYILWSRNEIKSNPLKIFIIVSFILEMLKRFTSGLLAEVMVLCLFLFIIIWYERKRIPIIFITITIVLFYIFSSVKAEYRVMTWNDGELSNANPLQKAQIFIDLAIQKFTLSEGKEDNLDNTSESIVNRTATIALFSRVVEDTPKLVPFYSGETYLPIFTSFIPRALWADKPEARTGNLWGHRYGYLEIDDYETSLNLPIIVEMYANFGETGVLSGMLLLGALLALIDLKFNSTRMNSLNVVVGATFLQELIFQESNASLVLGGLIPLIVALYLIFEYFLNRSISKIK